MKTDPTSGISGAAGMPLSYEVIQSERHFALHAKLETKPKDAISDTLETTDREGDGKRDWEMRAISMLEDALEQEEQDRLDLEG